jgi:hypothetical protein
MGARAAPDGDGVEVAARGPIAAMPRRAERNRSLVRMLQVTRIRIRRGDRVPLVIAAAAAVASASQLPRLDAKIIRRVMRMRISPIC